MPEILKVTTPLNISDICSLHAGDEVSISGFLLTGRDQAHKRLCEMIAGGQGLPVDLKGQVMYFVGPSPASEGRALGSAGPTTASRMDAFSGTLIEHGLKGMIGKGYRGEKVRWALEKYRAVHFATLGGAGALLSKHIVRSKIIAFEDLATEAIRRIEVVDFPAIVAYDCHGGSVYEDVNG